MNLRGVLQALFDLRLESLTDDFPVEFLSGSDQALGGKKKLIRESR